MNKKILYVYAVLAVMLATACTCNRTSNQLPKKEKEVKSSTIQVNIVRFEQDLFACNPNEIEAELAKLQAKYPVFYNVFYNQVLNIPAIGDKQMQLEVMRDFITKKAMKGLNDTV
ncbi:MAG TPA: hypothetical protein PLK15_02485 [Chitinophagales bacterium]|nr:hypothetical protein [Chitinophagales bacterium]